MSSPAGRTHLWACGPARVAGDDIAQQCRKAAGRSGRLASGELRPAGDDFGLPVMTLARR